MVARVAAKDVQAAVKAAARVLAKPVAMEVARPHVLPIVKVEAILDKFPSKDGINLKRTN
mgnify:CR=1 FL=1